MNAIASYCEVSGATIERFITNKLGPACEGELLPHAILGMIALCIRLMKPNIEAEELKVAVMSTSEHMFMILAKPEGGIN